VATGTEQQRAVTADAAGAAGATVPAEPTQCAAVRSGNTGAARPAGPSGTAATEQPTGATGPTGPAVTAEYARRADTTGPAGAAASEQQRGTSAGSARAAAIPAAAAGAPAAPDQRTVAAGSSGSSGGATRTTVTGRAEEPFTTPTGTPGAAADPTGAAGAAAAPPQSAVAARAAGAPAGPAHPAGAADAEQPPAIAAGPAAGGRSPRTARPTIAPQARRSARSAGLSNSACRAGAAVAEQDSAVPAGTARGGGIGTVTYQRPAEQRHRGRIDHAEDGALGVLDFGPHVRTRASPQRLGELSLQLLDERADGLIFATVRTEQRGDAQRYLVGGSSQDLRCRDCRGCVGVSNRRSESRHIRGSGSHGVGGDPEERHWSSSRQQGTSSQFRPTPGSLARILCFHRLYVTVLSNSNTYSVILINSPGTGSERSFSCYDLR